MTSVIEQLKEICFNETNGTFNSSRMSESFFLKNFPHLVDTVKSLTNFYTDEEIQFNKRIGLIIGGHSSRLQCKTCGNEIDPNNRSESKGKFFREYCCQECSGAANKGTKIVRTKEQQAAINAKRANTMIEKYGVAFNNQRSAVSSDEVLTDYTLVLDKNGNPSKPKKSKLINDATVADLKQRTGLDTDDVNTLLYFAMGKEPTARYCGCGKVLKIHNFQIGYRENQRNCGYECAKASEYMKDALRRSKIGVSRYDNESYMETRMRPWFEEKCLSITEEFGVSLVSTFDEYIADKKNVKLTCNSCGFSFTSDLSYNRSLYCKVCNPTSKPQTEIAKFVMGIGHEVIINDRKLLSGNEIDIFIPAMNIGIEYDGFYFHNAKDDSKKYAKATSAGIRMIRVFEDEYKNKRPIVLSRIRAILGKTERTLYARKCVVKEITASDCSEFLQNNHIQGTIGSSVRIGLFYLDELVAVMTFGAPRYNKKFEWELLRFASKLDTTVVGGASKLFTYFVSSCSPKSVVSYCDLRYGTGGVYEKLGFTFVKKTDQNYFYFKKGERFSRVKFQKHKLSGILDIFDETKSETENMLDNGYFKIFDNGNNVYEWYSK